MRRVMVAAAMVGVCLPLSGCQAMLFRNDHRIEIVRPDNLSTIAQPVVLQWSARDFSAPADGSFAVFVDRDPMPPGETMDYFGRNASRLNVYLVADTRLTLDQLQQNAGASDIERNHHDVTIVLLDPSGHRIGESAGFAEFSVTS